MDTLNSIPFAGKTITLSFYARAGANYSATSSALTIYLATGTGTDQNQQGAGYTGQALPISSTATLTTTWQRFTFSATLAATATEIQPIFGFTPVGTASTNDYFEVTGVQIEIGSSATAYYPNGNTYQAELAACKYYFKRMSITSGQFGYAQGMNQNTTTSSFIFNGVMRGTPTSTINGTLRLIQGNSDFAVTSINATYYSAPNDSVAVQFVTSGLTAGSTTQLYASTSGVSFDLSAEI